MHIQTQEWKVTEATAWAWKAQHSYQKAQKVNPRFLYLQSFYKVGGICIPKTACLAFSNRLRKVKEHVEESSWKYRRLLILLLWSYCFAYTAAPAVSPSDVLLHLYIYAEDNKMQRIQMNTFKRLLRETLQQPGLHRAALCLTTWIRFNLAPPVVIII